MLGDVNISAILDSFSVSYDKRVRPNYGGEFFDFSFTLFYGFKWIYIFYRENCFYYLVTIEGIVVGD